MLNLKRTAVAVIALGSSAAFAGTMGPVCSAVNVTVPCETTAWDFGAKALYLQPSMSDSFLTERTITTATGQSRDFGRNPNWGWGFMIEGSYHFNTGNDLNLNWYHLSKQSNRTIPAGNNVTTFTGVDGQINITKGVDYVSTNPKWDAVNLEFGQHVDFGESKDIRFHGGLAFVRLVNDLSTQGNTTVTVGSTTRSYSGTTTLNPSYNGVGARVGADMSYDWGNGFAMYANGAGALFAGASKFTGTVNDTLGNSYTMTGSRTAVVPELEAKLGGAYTYAMAQGDLTLDAGWMWINYFGALNLTNAGSAFDGTFNSSDFGLQGPYIGLKWVGNVA